MADNLKEALDNVMDFPGRKKEMPAIGMSIVMNIPGERQITLQSFAAQEDGLEVQTALLDRMTALADRQRAKYLIKDFEADLSSKLDEIKFRQVDYGRQVEARDKRIAEANEKISAYKAQIGEVNEQGYAKHVADGRKGPYSPKGHIQTQINAGNAGIKMEEERIKKIGEEWTQWEQSFQSTLDATNSKIEELKSAIRHCEATINPPKTAEDDGA